MRVAEAEYGLTDQALGRGNRAQADAHLRVTFGMFPQIDQDASDKEGRPIYKEVEYITIMVPGERDIVHRAAWKIDYDRFPQQYAAFKNKLSQDHAGGTPLKVVTWLSLGQVKELEYFNCFTLEQLASMPDSAAQKFMSINKLKQLAKDHLQAAKEAAPLTAMRAEMDKKDAEIAALQNQMKEILEKMAAKK